MSFRHLYFSPDLRGARARDDAAAALAKLAGKPAEWTQRADLADPFMFQDFYADRAPDQVAGVFGTGFAQALLPGSSRETGRVRRVRIGLASRVGRIEIPGRVPAFEEIEATVKSEWMDEQRAEAKRKIFETMRARYQIVLPQAAPTTPGGAVLPLPRRRPEPPQELGVHSIAASLHLLGVLAPRLGRASPRVAPGLP